MIQHECLRRMLRAFERGLIGPGDLGGVHVCHDDRCGAFKGRPCDCDCDIEVTCIDSSGRAKSYQIGSDGEVVATKAN